MNAAMDYEWFGSDAWEVMECNKLLKGTPESLRSEPELSEPIQPNDKYRISDLSRLRFTTCLVGRWQR